MGLSFGKRKEFPQNLTKLHPTSKHCRGPGLMADLTSGTREVYPKCNEGVRLKFRTNIGDTLKLGYNVVISTIAPSEPQIVLTHNNESGNAVLAISTNGTIALASKYHLTTSNIIDINSQIHFNNISVALVSLKYVGLKHTSSINFAGCHLPFGVLGLQNALLLNDLRSEPLRNVKKYYGNWGAEHVHKLNNFWAVGCELMADASLRMIICKRISLGKIGILMDKSRAEVFWLQKLTSRLELGGTADFYWDNSAPTATLACSWKTSRILAKTSITSDGLISTTFRSNILRTEDKLFAVTLSAVFNKQNNKFLLGTGIEGQM